MGDSGRDSAMADLNPSMEEIGLFVKKNIRDWVKPLILEFRREKELELAERFIRVEEELKSQRELMKQGFEQVDKRIEQVDKRFEQVDKRFEDMNKRFTSMQWFISLWFTLLAVLMSVYQFIQ